MAGITVGSSGGSGIVPNTELRVEVRPSADASWQLVPYLVPLESALAVVPTLSSARLRMEYGEILRSNRTSFMVERIRDFAGWQVRITAQGGTAGGALVTWVGIIPAETIVPHAGGSGAHEMTAVGVEYYLDRAPLASTWWKVGSGAVEIPVVESFNRRASNGFVVGNRTSAGIDGLHAFERGGEKWSALDMLEYAFGRMTIPGGLAWRVTGQTSMLAGWFPVVDAGDDWTVWRLVQRLLDRRRAISGRFVWYGEGAVALEVFSSSSVEYRGGGLVVEPNRRILDLDIAEGRLLSDAKIELQRMKKVGRLRVRGDRVVVAFSMSHADGTLVRGWSDGQQTAYNEAGSAVLGFGDAPDEAKAAIADQTRNTSPKLERVYRRFALDPDWDWEWEEREVEEQYVDWEASEATPQVRTRTLPGAIAMPDVDEDGWLLLDTKQAQAALPRVFLRHCALWKNVDYSVDPPVRAGGTEIDDELSPPVVWLLGTSVTAGDRIVQRLYEGSQGGLLGWPTVTVRPDESALALWVVATPAHLLAVQEFIPGENANPTQTAPQVEWQKMIATVAVETNRHVEVTRVLDAGAEEELVLRVEDAAVWWVAPGTVVDVTDAGLPIRVENPDGIITRDDRDLLRQIAALAAAWHGSPRVAVAVGQRGIGGLPVPGMMIGSLSGSAGRVLANSVVTEHRIDYAGLTTSIRTEYLELDELLAGMREGRSPRGRMGAAGSGGGIAEAQQALLGGVPVRWAAQSGLTTGSGTSGTTVVVGTTYFGGS